MQRRTEAKMMVHVHVLLGDLDILKCDSTGITGTLAHVLLLAANCDSLGITVNNETGECLSSLSIGISLVNQLGSNSRKWLVKEPTVSIESSEE